jgi:hypothetical protein
VRRSGQESKERAARVSSRPAPRPVIDAVLRPALGPGLAGLQAELRF